MNTVTITFPDGRSSRRTLPQRATWVLGRGADVDWALASPRVSSRHALLRSAPDGIAIRDERSTAGVLLGGEVIPPETWVPVPLGVHVALADVELIVTSRTTGAFTAPQVAVESTTPTEPTPSGGVERRALGLGLILLGALWTLWVVLSAR